MNNKDIEIPIFVLEELGKLTLELSMAKRSILDLQKQIEDLNYKNSLAVTEQKNDNNNNN